MSPQDTDQAFRLHTANSSRHLRETGYCFRLIFESASSVHDVLQSQSLLATKKDNSAELRYSSFNSNSSSYVRDIEYYFRQTFESASVILQAGKMSNLHRSHSPLACKCLGDRSFFMREGGLVGFEKHHLKIA